MTNRFKDITYDIVARLAHRPQSGSMSGKALIIRLDEIGDYMLWRPTLKHLVQVEDLKNKELTFCGNSSWKKIFELFDASYFQKIIWIDKIHFKKNLRYRYKILKDINRSNFDIVINPTYSRDKRNDDAIVLAAASKEAFGVVKNEENMRRYDAGYDHQLYTRLFSGPENPLFELERNLLFAEHLLGRKASSVDWKIHGDQLPNMPLKLPQPYLVVFPGSRNPNRIWPAEYFSEVATYCQKKWNWHIVVCGGPNDKIYADAFRKDFAGEMSDLTGLTNLPELMRVLHGANWLISVDTGVVHLAAAVGCPVSAIFNGSQYGRFAPYSPGLQHTVTPIYPIEISHELQNPKIVQEKYLYTMDTSYSLVKPRQGIETIKPSSVEDASKNYACNKLEH
jgi:ADP-heptose:LPS heptosyltransferase